MVLGNFRLLLRLQADRVSARGTPCSTVHLCTRALSPARSLCDCGHPAARFSAGHGVLPAVHLCARPPILELLSSSFVAALLPCQCICVASAFTQDLTAVHTDLWGRVSLTLRSLSAAKRCPRTLHHNCRCSRARDPGQCAARGLPQRSHSGRCLSAWSISAGGCFNCLGWENP